jgi:hypothetical protein
MSIKKLFIIFCLLLFQSGCDYEEEITVYRRQITIESNLKEFFIGELKLDSTITFPYILREKINTSLLPDLFILNPVIDTGYISIKLSGGVGINKPNIEMKDSLTIYTPIDSIKIFIENFNLDLTYN